MPPEDNTVERFISRIKRKPVVAALILVGSIIVGFATFTDAVKNISGLFSRMTPGEARLELGRLSLDYTPKDFIASAKKGDVYAIRLFLTEGMDPDATDGDDPDTPLMHAAREGHEQAVRELLNGNANVNRRGRDGDTALSVAVAHEPRLIKVLLKAGADLDSRNRAFEAAARVSNPDLFPVLMKAGLSRDVVARALFAASGSATLALDRRRDETVKSLIDLGAEVNGKNEKGQTPMLLAAERGHLSVIKILLNRGAAIDAGCDCPTSEGAGWTPLMVAIVDGHDEVAEFLMEKGADMNRKNQATGETALELAANKADAETIRYLLKKGADVNAHDKNGRTALMAALNNNSNLNNVDLVTTLIEHGADVNARDNDKWTALMWAALTIENDSARYLMDHGADVNAKSTTGVTALMVAADKGDPDAVRTLLKHGARINDRDSKGKTALRHALEGPEVSSYRTEAIQVLQRADAQ